MSRTNKRRGPTRVFVQNDYKCSFLRLKPPRPLYKIERSIRDVVRTVFSFRTVRVMDNKLLAGKLNLLSECKHTQLPVRVCLCMRVVSTDWHAIPATMIIIVRIYYDTLLLYTG